MPLGQLEEGKDSFFKVNINQSGYYRVQYSDALWRANARAAGANDSALSQSDVAGLLDDAYTLHQIEGAINITVWLELLQCALPFCCLTVAPVCMRRGKMHCFAAYAAA